jgi:hypothetical protein
MTIVHQRSLRTSWRHKFGMANAEVQRPELADMRAIAFAICTVARRAESALGGDGQCSGCVRAGVGA